MPLKATANVTGMDGFERPRIKRFENPTSMALSKVLTILIYIQLICFT